MDKQLTCKDCQAPFVFSEGEQEFFVTMGFPDPVRCPACREHARRARYAREHGAPPPALESYPIRCDRCGKPDVVKFRPQEGRPVYCKTCLKAHREEGVLPPRGS